jgi:hypothetical protein
MSTQDAKERLDLLQGTLDAGAAVGLVGALLLSRVMAGLESRFTKGGLK